MELRQIRCYFVLVEGGGHAILPHAAAEQEIGLGLVRKICGYCQPIQTAKRGKIDVGDWRGAQLKGCKVL